jgi:hypothetical protein
MLLGANMKFYVLRLAPKAHKTIFAPNNIQRVTEISTLILTDNKIH